MGEGCGHFESSAATSTVDLECGELDVQDRSSCRAFERSRCTGTPPSKPCRTWVAEAFALVSVTSSCVRVASNSSEIDLEHETVDLEHEHVDDRDRRRSTARPDRPNIPIPMTYRSHTQRETVEEIERAETVEAEHVERRVGSSS